MLAICLLKFLVHSFSYQIETSILDATLLLYAVFINLNIFCLAILCVFMTVRSYFHFHMHVPDCSTAFHTAHNSVDVSINIH